MKGIDDWKWKHRSKESKKVCFLKLIQHYYYYYLNFCNISKQESQKTRKTVFKKQNDKEFCCCRWPWLLLIILQKLYHSFTFNFGLVSFTLMGTKRYIKLQHTTPKKIVVQLLKMKPNCHFSLSLSLSQAGLLVNFWDGSFSSLLLSLLCWCCKFF